MDTLRFVTVLVVGLALLILGGGLFRRGLVGVARQAGLGALWVGLSAVALGASTPELAVATWASSRGATDLALGTIVGSVVFHVLFILGLSALVMPLSVSARWIRMAIPLIILAALGLLGLSWDGVLSRCDGAILLGALVVWWAWTLFRSRRESEEVRQEFAALAEGAGARTVMGNLFLVLLGAGLLSLGAFGTMEGVSRLVAVSGVRYLLFGLTVVGIGTSLPELATSLRATRHGQRDVAVGQVVGGSLTLLLGVTGIAALVAPRGWWLDPETARLDLELLIGVAIFCTPIYLLGNQVSRASGFFFVVCYASYLAWLVLRALWPAWSVAYLQLVVMLALPLAVILVMLAALKTLRQQRPARPVRHRIRGI